MAGVAGFALGLDDLGAVHRDDDVGEGHLAFSTVGVDVFAGDVSRCSGHYYLISVGAC